MNSAAANFSHREHTSGGQTATIQSGLYKVSGDGLFSSTIVDSISTGYQIGAAGTYSTSSGFSSVILTHAATAQNAALFPNRGSFMLWVRSWTP